MGFAGLEEFPERGDEEGTYGGVHGHAEYYGGSEAYAACGSGSGGEEHGHHAEHESQGGHHDGAETDVAGACYAYTACGHRHVIVVADTDVDERVQYAVAEVVPPAVAALLCKTCNAPEQHCQTDAKSSNHSQNFSYTCSLGGNMTMCHPSRPFYNITAAAAIWFMTSRNVRNGRNIIPK